MMFQGSANYDADYFTPLQEAGGIVNGTTNVDRTWYFETVPSNFLELALYMEADRLANLLPAMTQEKLDNQRDVVKNERRQRYDNPPYGTAFEKIAQIMFPKPHPYNWTTIGSLEDLQAASMDDVKDFFRQYYTARNTILVVSGDFDEKQAKGWIEKYFSVVEPGADIKRPNDPLPKLDKEIRTTVEDNVPLPRRYFAWHTPRAYSADEPALDILSFILTNGRTSRLQSNLVYSKEMAQTVLSGNGSNELAGVFQIQATARPNKSLDDIEKEIDAELDRITATPPTADEMSRALNSIESSTIGGLSTVLGKASQLTAYAGYLGKADWFQADLDRYRRVTAADVSRVAKTYLGDNRLVMSYVPRTGEANRASRGADKPTSVKSEKKDDNKRIAEQAARLPKPGPDPKLTLPPVEKTKLDNGMEVWMVEHRELPLVAMNMVFRTGSASEPDDRTGLARTVSELIDDGTATRSAADIANQLQALGAGLGTGSTFDWTNVTLNTLTKNLDKAIDIYADVIQNPSFPASEVELVKSRSLVSLRQQKANPNAIGSIVYNKVLYDDHPYGRIDTEATIKAMTRDDLVSYYNSTYRPNNAVLIVVGSFDKAALKAKLNSAFGGWKSGDVADRPLPETKPLEKTGIYIVDRPNSAQSVVGVGHVGIERSHPDYFKVLLMNNILGGGITGRISMNLREDKGYTYGANSAYAFRRGPGPFRAGGDMQTAVTKEAVWELMQEIKGARGERPFTQKELDYYKQRLIRLTPGGFETPTAISNQLATLITYGLPDSYYNDYIARINAVTLDDVNTAAQKYLDPSRMAIVIVGDRKIIEPRLAELGFPITILDVDGNPVTK
jgi:zinc protease